MNFMNLPIELTDEVFSYLTVKELCGLAFNKIWRERTNQDSFWRKQCHSRGWSKFGDESDPAYILDNRSGSERSPSSNTKQLCKSLSSFSLVSQSSSSKCITWFTPRKSTLPKWCKWKEVFMNARRLNENWNNNCYILTRVPRNSKSRISSFGSNGRVLLEGRNDGSLVLWNLSPQKFLHHHDIGQGIDILIIKFYKCRIAIGCSDGTIHVFDTEMEWKLVEKFCVHNGKNLRHLEFEKKLIVSAYTDGQLVVCGLQPSTRLLRLTGHTGLTKCLSMSGDRVVTGFDNGTLIIWNAATGELLKPLHGHKVAVTCCQFRNQKVVSGSSDGSMFIWDADTGVCLSVLGGLLLSVSSIESIAVDDHFIATTNLRGMVLLWKWNGQSVYIQDKYVTMMNLLQFQDGRLIGVGAEEKHPVIIWDPESGRRSTYLPIGQKSVRGMWVGESKVILFSACRNPKLGIINYWTGLQEDL